jgi:hypothetical protein
MPSALRGERTVADFYAGALRKIEGVLQQLEFIAELRDLDELGLLNHFLLPKDGRGGWELKTLEVDHSRSRRILPEQPIRSGNGSPTTIYLVEIPLVSRPSNCDALLLRSAANWPDFDSMKHAGSYRTSNDTLEIRAVEDDIIHCVETAEKMLLLINADIEVETNLFRDRLLQRVRYHRRRVADQADRSAYIGKRLGISSEVETAVTVATGSSYAELNDVLGHLKQIPTGNDAASQYHDFILDTLVQLFSPALANPKKEQEINEGRKRIDIAFTNRDTKGFFYFLSSIHQVRCPYIFFECKNYGKDVANPEIDQLAGRFSDIRGKLGFLVCRSVSARDTLLRRCRDLVRDKGEYVLVLTDDEISDLLRLRAVQDSDGTLSYLENLLAELTL